MAFPLWALLVGRGFAAAWARSLGHSRMRAGLAVLFVSQGYGVVALIRSS